MNDKVNKLCSLEWVPVLQNFHAVLGPFLQLPYHVVLGDRDIGECSSLDAKSIYRLTRNFPGLDPAGCGVFEISDISFVSLNSVALLCGNSELRFDIEKVIETESILLQMINDYDPELMDRSGEPEETAGIIRWRRNLALLGSGPVLLLHFPLHQTGKQNCNGVNCQKKVTSQLLWGLDALQNRDLTAAPYKLEHTLPLNATEYILQALKPRIIFSAHNHEFCEITHSDGTREITVPSMAWKARNDPGFIISTFSGDRKIVNVCYCALAKESHVLMVYSLVLVVSLTTFLMNSTRQLKFLKR